MNRSWLWSFFANVLYPSIRSIVFAAPYYYSFLLLCTRKNLKCSTLGMENDNFWISHPRHLTCPLYLDQKNVILFLQAKSVVPNLCYRDHKCSLSSLESLPKRVEILNILSWKLNLLQNNSGFPKVLLSLVQSFLGYDVEHWYKNKTGKTNSKAIYQY